MKAPLWLRAVSLLSLGLPAGLGGQARGGGGPVPVTLASMRDAYRPLLVFAPTDRDPRLVTQLGFLAEKGDELHERQVILVPLLLRSSGRPWRVASNADIGLMEASEADVARKRFHIDPDAFTVVLLGKDGGEKLRSGQPIAYDQLRETIDAMPMRQEEMRHPR